MDLEHRPSTDPLALLIDVPLSDDEAGYVAAARAGNTLKGYRSDWAEWCSWCATEGFDPLAGDPRPSPGTPSS